MFSHFTTVTVFLLLFLLSHCEESGKNTETTYDVDEQSNNSTSETEFPGPTDKLEVVIDAAKVFIQKYLSGDKWHKLKRLLATVREIGGSQRDSYRAVSVFLARVLSSDQKKEIMARRKELFKVFGDRR